MQVILKADRISIGVILACLAAPAFCGTVVVGSGVLLDTGDGSVHLGCGDMNVSGVLRGNAQGARDVRIENGGAVEPELFAFSGDWSNTGNSTVGGTVWWEDNCGVSDASMLGNSDFSRFEVVATAGVTRRFDTAGVQYVHDSLTLTGAGGTLLTLRSTWTGKRGVLILAPGGSQTVTLVDVADLDASGGETLAPGAPEASDSVDSGNNANWFKIETVDEVFRDRFSKP